MAGDWLKIEAATPDKAETFAITVAMGWDDPDLTVGKLLRVWRWFDQHTVDGNAHGVTSALLDRFIGTPGFAEAMRNVGWLVITDDGITLPNFDRHNGKTAKARGMTARRVQRFNTLSDANGATVTQALAKPLGSALPREEKRREEKRKVKGLGVAVAPAARQQVEEFAVTTERREWAAKNAPDVDLNAATEQWQDHCRANGYRTGKDLIRDPAAAWRTWIRNEVRFGRPTGVRNVPTQPSGPDPYLWPDGSRRSTRYVPEEATR